MTLLDLLNRDLRLEWHEAVALVQDIVERSSEIGRGFVPELHQVELLAWGQVEVHSATAGGDPVQRLAALLNTLLTDADPPVQLRLLIAQPHESVRAFSEALAFFERPDRAPILQLLYNRATAALPLRRLQISDSVTEVTASSSDNQPGAAEPRKARRGRLPYVAAVLASLVCVGAAASYAARASSSPEADEADLASRVSKGVSEVTEAVGSAVLAIGERVGLKTGEAQPAVATVEPKTEVTSTIVRGRPNRSGRTSTPQLPTLDQTVRPFDLGLPGKDPVAVSDSVTVVAQPHSGEHAPTDVDTNRVFTAASTDVVPPVGIRPQLPKELPPGVRIEDLTRIELLILPDGTVDSVKLLSVPRNVHEAMLLSAAKAWRFHPAMKDGLPVRYLKTVWVSR